MTKPVDVTQTDDRNLANWLHALPDSAITNGNAVEYWRAGFRFNKALTLVEAQAAEIKRLRDAIDDAPHDRICARVLPDGGVMNGCECDCWRAALKEQDNEDISGFYATHPARTD